jgi:hypothetical protein
VSIRNAHMDEGVAAADAVAESSAERWRFSGGSDSETGSSGGTHVAPSERWRSGWDGEFESLLRWLRRTWVGLTLGGSGLMVKALGQMEKNAIGGAAAGRGDTRDPPKEGGFPVERGHVGHGYVPLLPGNERIIDYDSFLTPPLLFFKKLTGASTSRLSAGRPPPVEWSSEVNAKFVSVARARATLETQVDPGRQDFGSKTRSSGPPRLCSSDSLGRTLGCWPSASRMHSVQSCSIIGACDRRGGQQGRGEEAKALLETPQQLYGLPRPTTARMIPPRRRSIGPNSAKASKPLPLS